MGWFKVPGHEDVTLGDDVLDETYAFLKKLSGMYEKALGRKISCDELRVLLETSLVANADDSLFSGFEEQKISAVQLKTAKRAKRATYKAGDLFAVPLGPEQFAFGRIMQTGASSGTLVELFKATSRSAAPTPRITESGRLFHPIYLNGLRAFRDLAFPIVGLEPEYTPTDLESLEFRSGVAGDYEVSRGTSKPRPVSDAEAKGVEPVSLWEPESLIKRVAKTLSPK